MESGGLGDNVHKNFDSGKVITKPINSESYPLEVSNPINPLKIPSNPISNEPSKKFNKKLLIFPLIFIFGLLIFLFIFSSTKISDNDISVGTNFELEEGDEIKFFLDEEEHLIKLTSVDENSVNIIIRSEPISANFNVGEEKKFDLNGDTFYNVKIKLVSIDNGIPEFYIKKIYESSCISDWDCGDWSSCVDSEKTRVCEDLNSCNVEENKPDEIQSCSLQTLDCGTSTISDLGDITFSLDDGSTLDTKDYDSDSALTCFGENLLNDCADSKIIIVHESGTVETVETTKNSMGDCEVKTTFGTIADGDLNYDDFGDTFWECSANQEKLLDWQCFFSFCPSTNAGGNSYGQKFMNVLANMYVEGSRSNPQNICSGDRFGNLCSLPQDCTDYTSTTSGYCLSGSCEYHPWDGNCRIDSDCSGTCENCASGGNVKCQTNLIISSSTGSSIESSCIDCQTHSDCGNGFLCNGANDCVNNVLCVDASDCLTEEYCPFGSNSVCTPKLGLGADCLWADNSCSSGLCIDDTCVDENFFDSFTTCQTNSDCVADCVGCDDGAYSCSQPASSNNKICVQCIGDSNCLQGYKCEFYECVEN
jgi:hypothetical protein